MELLEARRSSTAYQRMSIFLIWQNEGSGARVNKFVQTFQHWHDGETCDTFGVPAMSFIAHGFINLRNSLAQLTYNLTGHPHDWT